MPLWKIFHSPGMFKDPATKKSLSQSITDFYVSRTGMPAFYVGVIFFAIPEQSLYIGGEARHADTPFVRFEVDQIHIALPEGDDEIRKRHMEGINEMLRPFMGRANWEVHCDETDRRLWSIDGIAPPEWRSEEEDRWREAGRALERL